MSDTIHFTIDGRPVTAKPGETILNVARREGIYIPTMCYLEKTEPAASCRLCVVECDGVDGMILSCQTPPTEGLAVTTDNAALHEERTNIMRLYDVNHPLECGVCDKSGACDLQNKTLEFNVGEQLFTAKDQPRHNKKWGFINYDPSLDTTLAENDLSPTPEGPEEAEGAEGESATSAEDAAEDEQKKVQGAQRADKLRQRFDGWYYVISDSSFKQIHKDRGELFKDAKTGDK